MIKRVKSLLRNSLPKSWLKILRPCYHGAIAWLAHYKFGKPSHELIVIGITGTAGKSTTVIVLAKLLSATLGKTGYITTAGSSNGNTETINKIGLSMPDGWSLNYQLSQMVKQGCRFAVIECTSEGLAQNRHLGIAFDGALFTNLAPAHLDSHGGYENYRAAKNKLFAQLGHTTKSGNLAILSFIGVNGDDQEANFFLKNKAVRKFAILSDNLTGDLPENLDQTYQLIVQEAIPHLKFKLNDTEFQSKLFGQYNSYNLALATAITLFLGADQKQIQEELKTINPVAGRMEEIANNKGFRIFVDYAPEPLPMEQALKAVSSLPHQKIIHVFGATGGSRDVGKRFEFGKLSAQYADTIIITNDDVYDSDPEMIAADILSAIKETNQSNKKVSLVKTVLDRKQAIAESLSIAKTNDIILITGKGSEQFLILPNNQRIAWDEPSVIKEVLNQ